MEFSGVTHTVSNIAAARQFYEEILGFEAGPSYAPTGWQAYKMQAGIFYAIGLAPGSTDEVSFLVTDLEGLWQRIKEKVEIVHPLERTAWGTHRFVIKDPDGHLLAFGQKK